MSEKTKNTILTVLGFGFRAAWFIAKIAVAWFMHFIYYIAYVMMPQLEIIVKQIVFKI